MFQKISKKYIKFLSFHEMDGDYVLAELGVHLQRQCFPVKIGRSTRTQKIMRVFTLNLRYMPGWGIFSVRTKFCENKEPWYFEPRSYRWYVSSKEKLKKNEKQFLRNIFNEGFFTSTLRKWYKFKFTKVFLRFKSCEGRENPQ